MWIRPRSAEENSGHHLLSQRKIVKKGERQGIHPCPGQRVGFNFHLAVLNHFPHDHRAHDDEQGASLDIDLGAPLRPPHRGTEEATQGEGEPERVEVVAERERVGDGGGARDGWRGGAGDRQPSVEGGWTWI